MSGNDAFVRPRSSEYLFSLPPRACVAFAVRCARRLQPALIAEGHESTSDVDDLLASLELFCRGDREIDDAADRLFRSLDYIDDKEDYFSDAETAIVVARWAALAAKFPENSAGPAHLAAEYVYLKSSEAAEAAWGDFRRLRDAVERGDVAEDSGIDQSFFEPICTRN